MALQQIPGWNVSIDAGSMWDSENIPPCEGHVTCEAFERFDIGILDELVSKR